MCVSIGRQKDEHGLNKNFLLQDHIGSLVLSRLSLMHQEMIKNFTKLNSEMLEIRDSMSRENRRRSRKVSQVVVFICISAYLATKMWSMSLYM